MGAHLLTRSNSINLQANTVQMCVPSEFGTGHGVGSTIVSASAEKRPFSDDFSSARTICACTSSVCS